MAEITALKAQRGARRGVVTRKAKELNIAVPNINIIAELEGAVALLVNYQIQLKKFDDDIQSRIIKATELEVDMEESNQYVLALNYTLSLLKDRIKNLKDGDVLNFNIKLPRLDLPKFSGDLAEWTHFWDSFNQIHDGRQYSKIDKIR